MVKAVGDVSEVGDVGDLGEVGDVGEGMKDTWDTADLCFFTSSFISSWSSSMRDCKSFFSLCKRLNCSSS